MTIDDDASKVAPQTNTSVNAERKHLEGLLNNRFNFNLVFTSVFLAGLSHLEEPIRLVTLIVGTTISLLISLAICRTHLLVGKVLDDLKKFEPDVPYVKYSKQVGLPNANYLLIPVPFILTALFAFLTAVEMVKMLRDCGD